jgi:hypothetical protein
MEGRPGFSRDDQRQRLEFHLGLGPQKAISYLPIKTVEKILGLSLLEYVSMVESAGDKAIVLGVDECCIDSGAVYAYSPNDLRVILKDAESLLLGHGWPASPVDFIRKLAAEWLDQDNPVLPIVRTAFGDG